MAKSVDLVAHAAKFCKPLVKRKGGRAHAKMWAALRECYGAAGIIEAQEKLGRFPTYDEAAALRRAADEVARRNQRKR